ncbi:MAG: Glu-tRNA(Gln) amidotransferase subunit GatE [Pseudomonadota bacterium]
MKTPVQMTAQDYRALGFRCGLEIHQQLRTRKKLFCHCPNTTYANTFDAELLRHMRPTLSELGEYDGTALMEFKTHKEIIYRIARDTVCTYEMDDTPPFMINDEALDIGLEITLLLGCKLVSEVHIARKQYLDGSIPAGFQRTTILGVDGAVPFEGRSIRIRQLGLEEDACREVSDVRHRRTYLTDRLSIPLVEMVTEPEMLNPTEAAGVAQVLRGLARSTGKVRTGHGAARQDVNVSIRGGARAEIKGVPRIPLIPALTHYEALRQKALLEIREVLLGRGVSAASISDESFDVTGIVKRTHFGPIRQSVDLGNPVRAVCLPGFKGILNTETGPNNVFAREFEGRVKVIACLDALPNLLYNDALELSLSGRLWDRVRHAVSAGPSDAVVLVWGPERDLYTAASELQIRAREATIGVPNETRRALADGSTVFERILPGPDRMYPDTDHPPVAIADARVENIRAGLQPLPWERLAAYAAQGLPEHLGCLMLRSPRRQVFEEVLALSGCPSVVVAVVLGQLLKGLKRARIPVDAIPDAHLEVLFRLFSAGRFTREAFPEILTRMAAAPDAAPGAVIDALLPQPPPPETVPALVRDALADGTWRRDGAPAREFLLAMAAAMDRLRGLVPGRTVAALVRATISEGGAA